MDGIDAITSQVAELNAEISVMRDELQNHQHNGVIYSQTNNGDLFHTATVVAISPTATAASFNPISSDVFTITPTGSITLTVLASNIPSGIIISIVIKTSGTTAYTISFGSGFTAVGTLTTVNLDGRYYTITFACDGVNLREVARTAAMLPS